MTGHAMVCDKLRRKLYVIAGKRKEKYLADMWMFDLDTHVIEKMSTKVQDPVFSMRVVLDEASQMLIRCATHSLPMAAFIDRTFVA
jgi:hypothetical protein